MEIDYGWMMQRLHEIVLETVPDRRERIATEALAGILASGVDREPATSSNTPRMMLEIPNFQDSEIT